jgi:hypothetical protein
VITKASATPEVLEKLKENETGSKGALNANRDAKIVSLVKKQKIIKLMAKY